jgi:hypothetical protein
MTKENILIRGFAAFAILLLLEVASVAPAVAEWLPCEPHFPIKLACGLALWGLLVLVFQERNPLLGTQPPPVKEPEEEK